MFTIHRLPLEHTLGDPPNYCLSLPQLPSLLRLGVNNPHLSSDFSRGKYRVPSNDNRVMSARPELPDRRLSILFDRAVEDSEACKVERGLEGLTRGGSTEGGEVELRKLRMM